MKDTFARVIVISPVLLHGSQTSLIISGVLFAVLAWADSGRAPRSSYSIIIRNAIFFSFLVWSWILLFGVSVGFWFVLSHGTVGVFLFWNMVTTTIAHHFIYPLVQHNYHDALKTGWHPFWDTSMFNFDSELIKDGGFEEPEYKNFVPPKHWQFQCPACGARQQTDFGVCWNCNYGAGVILAGPIRPTHRVVPATMPPDIESRSHRFLETRRESATVPRTSWDRSSGCAPPPRRD